MEMKFELTPYRNNSTPFPIEKVKFVQTGSVYDEGKVTVEIVNSEFDSFEFQLDLDELIKVVEILKATK